MHFLGLPMWAEYLLQGIFIFIMLASSAVVLTRAGKSPYFALLVMVPYVQIIAIWVLAFMVWKKNA